MLFTMGHFTPCAFRITAAMASREQVHAHRSPSPTEEMMREAERRHGEATGMLFLYTAWFTRAIGRHA